MKKALKTPDGLAHVMSLLSEEETNNAALVAAVQQQPPLPPPPTNTPAAAPNPSVATANVATVNSKFQNLATKVKLQSILKNGKK